MQKISNLVFQHQLTVVTCILLVMYFFAIVPKTAQLFKYLSKNKSLLKKTLYMLFFLVSATLDITIMILAIHGIVYFLKA